MNDALNVLVLGALVGFGLSVFVDAIGLTIGRTLAIFDGSTS